MLSDILMVQQKSTLMHATQSRHAIPLARVRQHQYSMAARALAYAADSGTMHIADIRKATSGSWPRWFLTVVAYLSLALLGEPGRPVAPSSLLPLRA